MEMLTTTSSGFSDLDSLKPLVLPILDRMRGTESVALKRKCLKILRDIGSDAIEALPLLIEIVRQDRSNGTKLLAIQAIGGIGERADSAVELLADFLTPKDAEELLLAPHAAKALASIGSSRAAPYLLNAFRGNRDENIRVSSISALSKLSASPEVFLPSLHELLLNQEYKDYNDLLIRAMTCIGKDSAIAESEILKLFEYTSMRCEWVSLLTHLSNLNILSHATINYLTRLLQSLRDLSVEEQMALAQTIDILLRKDYRFSTLCQFILVDPSLDENVLFWFAHAFSRMNSSEAIPKLLALTSSRYSQRVRLVSIHGLWANRANCDKSCFDQLSSIIEDKDNLVREAARQVLVRLSEHFSNEIPHDND